MTGTLSPAWFDLASFSNMVTLDLSSQQVCPLLQPARTCALCGFRRSSCCYCCCYISSYNISYMQLAGSLPAAWGTSWADQPTRGLQQLDLSRNSLSGEVGCC